MTHPAARYLLVHCLFSVLCTCAPPPDPPPTLLDQATIDDPTGWRLRIHGDGSGTLTHQQYPRHHLDYPAATFRLRPAVRLTDNCADLGRGPLCPELTYYRADTNEEYYCGCAPYPWVERTVAVALANMQWAVDDAGSEHSCRLLRREWLASR